MAFTILLHTAADFMRDGEAGLGHPPSRGGAGQAEACLQGGVKGFSKGSERPGLDASANYVIPKP